MEEETLFEEFKGACNATPVREHHANKWMSDATWKLMDHQTAIWRGKQALLAAVPGTGKTDQGLVEIRPLETSRGHT